MFSPCLVFYQARSAEDIAKPSAKALGENTKRGGITAVHEGEALGTHTVRWSSPVDEIILEHRAHSRTGFAAGAVLAAEWVAGKTGVCRMEDVPGI